MNKSIKHGLRPKRSFKPREWIRSISWKRSTKYQPADSLETNPLPASVSLIRSLSELLFTDFIVCSCDNDYRSLIKEGEPTEDDLVSAWITLVSEYQDLTGSTDAAQSREMSRKIEAYNTKILHVTGLVEALKPAYNSLLADELRTTWEYNLPFTEESYLKDLQKVTAKLGNDKTKLAIILKQYTDEQKENEGKPGTTKQDYMQVLYSIEESKKMEFDLEKLTAYKFATMYNAQVERNKILKSKYAGSKS